jgi:PadR family transcriptional regulator
MGHRAAHTADFTRCAAGGPGIIVSGLHRLEARSWIASEWGESENNLKAKYYKLTAAGRKQLENEIETWRLFTGAVELNLKTS